MYNSYEENYKVEQEITSFVIHNYFNKNNIEVQQSGDSNEFQYAGIDLFVLENGKLDTYDLKAASTLKYISTPPDSFILVVQTVTRGGKVEPGWFLNDKKINTKYMFIWVNKAELINGEVKEEGIEEIEFSIVDRKLLLDYILNNVISKEELNNKIKNNKVRAENLGYGFRLQRNWDNVGIIVNKEKLQSLAELNKIVAK